jgi:hypothetical protein
MSLRKGFDHGDWGDVLMFLERVVPRGSAEADRLEYLIKMINRILDNNVKQP